MQLANYPCIFSGDGANFGVDVNTGGIADSFANFVWEPSVVKVQDFSLFDFFTVANLF